MNQKLYLIDKILLIGSLAIVVLCIITLCIVVLNLNSQIHDLETATALQTELINTQREDIELMWEKVQQLDRHIGGMQKHILTLYERWNKK